MRILAAQEKCDWNIPGWNIPVIMKALKYGKTEMVEILVRCPCVDLNRRDSWGWSLVFQAIERNTIGKSIIIHSNMN